jgi:lysophospholipase L1-like esterase
MEIIRKKKSSGGPVVSGNAWKYPFGYNIESGLARWPLRRAEAVDRIVRVNLTGDSITRGAYSSDDTTKSYGAQLRNILAPIYGDSGYGYINAREGYSGLATHQTASGVYGAQKRVQFLDAADAEYVPTLVGVGGFGGEYMRIFTNCKCVFNNVVGNKFTLLYVDLPGSGEWGGGKARIEVDGNVVLNNIGDNSVLVETPRAVTFTVPAGTHTIRVVTTTNRFAVSGIICQTADKGIQINRVGREAWKTGDWANRADSHHLAWELTPADLHIIALGTNDLNPGIVSQSKANMSKIINEIKATQADVLLYLMHQPAQGWANYTVWPEFVKGWYELADEHNVGLLDGHKAWWGNYQYPNEMGFFAPSPNDFSGGPGNDQVHPSDKGYRYMALTIANLLKA